MHFIDIERINEKNIGNQWEKLAVKCPVCNKPAISYFDWMKGLRWYKTNCISCGAGLEAAKSTWLAFILSVLFGLASSFYAFARLRLSLVPSLLIGIAVILAIATITFYALSGYRSPGGS
ncbi:MAG: hypothetical protein P8047_08775 [Gammaproteobacteria bacterium]